MERESLKSHRVAYKEPVVFIWLLAVTCFFHSCIRRAQKNIIESEMKYMFNFVCKLM